MLLLARIGRRVRTGLKLLPYQKLGWSGLGSNGLQKN